MSVHLIVYSSTSLLSPAYADREVADIVATSIDRNGRHGVTGALLHTEEQRFAQALEGNAEAVGSIMRKIRSDIRHTKIISLCEGPVPQRHFADWSLAFRGHAPSVDHIIRAAEYEVGLASNKALGELLGVMEYLVRRP
jgi:hypothetical protein